ncbi:MAG: alginate export family protein [Planctomycetales bacterium]|nr:alginate export family protein [Planctomycetales bacterium]
MKHPIWSCALAAAATALSSAWAGPPTPNPCAASHKGVFYLNDFSYLDDPSFDGSCLGDSFKLLPVAEGNLGTLDVGGELRMRYHHERGMGQSMGLTRFEDTTTNFWLTRLRTYANWQVADGLRFYCEGIYADASRDDGNYTRRSIDTNYGDFLNLFVDLGLTENTTLRVGRQELLYGSQRLVSPLDWANTRRTFEGARLLYNDGDWAANLFYTNLVVVNPTELDKADYDQSFYGCYSTYSGFESYTVDAYYLGYDNEHTGPPNAGQDFSIHTLGLRVNGSLTDKWLFEMEGGPQFGRQSGLGLDQDAMFATAGLGRTLGDVMPWSPTMWFYYDYAAGNNIGGNWNRFNQLFPLAHRYFGFIDAVQRANVESPNVLLTMNPSAKTTLLFWYWHFMANQDTDIIPANGGTPPQGISKDYGDELDVVAQFGLSPSSNILFGWSHLWRGNKILAPNDADFFYTQYTLNF